MHIITFTINGKTAIVSDETQVTKHMSVGDTLLFKTSEGIELFVQLKSADSMDKWEKSDTKDDWSVFDEDIDI